MYDCSNIHIAAQICNMGNNRKTVKARDNVLNQPGMFRLLSPSNPVGPMSSFLELKLRWGHDTGYDMMRY